MAANSKPPEPPKESTTPNLDYLREQVTALKNLLDDPQPGLASWVMLYGEKMQAITDFWKDPSTR